ncbi:MAG: hypothetical protein IJU80_03610 [Lachnospiraceae bacterium]|nr:hypothetical protein [Lachnospiraceae bacterium]
MEYIIWIPAILGLFAFLSIGDLKNRISRLEDQLSFIKGSPAHAEKAAPRKLLNDYVNKNVELEFRGEQYDGDLSVPGNTCTVLAVDEEWVFVRIVTRKEEKEKLFRLSQISGVKGIA